MRAGNADLWSGLALAALAGYIIVQAWGWEYMGTDGPGPGFFPLWYGIAMAALSLALVASSVLRGRSSEAERIDWSTASRALAAWLAFAVAVAAAKLVGFAVAFALLVFFLVAALYRKPLKVAAAVALLSAVAFYVVFPLALGVALP
jgi:putative tricarboxylic transport membrane protein